MSNKVIMKQDIPITVASNETDDYICITDIACAKSEQLRTADFRMRKWKTS